MYPNIPEGKKFCWNMPVNAAKCLSQLGTDATEAFEDIGHSSVARELLKDYIVGTLSSDGDIIIPLGKPLYTNHTLMWPLENQQPETFTSGLGVWLLFLQLSLWACTCAKKNKTFNGATLNALTLAGLPLPAPSH